VLQQSLESHNNEIVDVKAGTKVVGAELERQCSDRVIAEHKHCTDQEVKRWEEKHQRLASEVDLMEECQRGHRHNFGARGDKRELHGYSGNNTKYSEGGDEAGRLREGILCNQSGGRRGRRRPVLDLSSVVQRYNCLETADG